MLELKEIKVNGRSYTVTPMNPMQGYLYCHEVQHVQKNRLPQYAIGRKALAQCVTPENTMLSDDNAFDAWFAKYPEDIIALEIQAKEVLLGPFVPKKSDTKKTAKS